tara:strand:+ start:24602 stop:24967 length:366 start_codon:yes stop_codon:yes gene_type:complete
MIELFDAVKSNENVISEEINYFDEEALEISFLNETITAIEIYLEKIKVKISHAAHDEKLKLFSSYTSLKEELTRIRSRMALHRKYQSKELQEYLYTIEDDLYHLEFKVIEFYEALDFFVYQ